MQQNKITTGNLNQEIEEVTKRLLEMASEHAWNRISSKVRYVIKKVKIGVVEGENFFETNRTRKKILNLKEKLTRESAVKQLISDFENIYQIELYIFKANKNETIVEIEILEKSALEREYKKTVLDNCPTIHCKVAIPPYIGLATKNKFDINWQLETFEFKWRMFWKKAIT